MKNYLHFLSCKNFLTSFLSVASFYTYYQQISSLAMYHVDKLTCKMFHYGELIFVCKKRSFLFVHISLKKTTNQIMEKNTLGLITISSVQLNVLKKNPKALKVAKKVSFLYILALRKHWTIYYVIHNHI